MRLRSLFVNSSAADTKSSAVYSSPAARLAENLRNAKGIERNSAAAHSVFRSSFRRCNIFVSAVFALNAVFSAATDLPAKTNSACLPLSIRLASSTSSSLCSKGTLPISFRYIRTGSSMLIPSGTDMEVANSASVISSFSLTASSSSAGGNASSLSSSSLK